jgi:hypothetical protein
MLHEIDIQNILFLDIETVPQHASFEDLSVEMKNLWEKKSAYFRADDKSASDVYPRQLFMPNSVKSFVYR